MNLLLYKEDIPFLLRMQLLILGCDISSGHFFRDCRDVYLFLLYFYLDTYQYMLGIASIYLP